MLLSILHAQNSIPQQNVNLGKAGHPWAQHGAHPKHSVSGGDGGSGWFQRSTNWKEHKYLGAWQHSVRVHAPFEERDSFSFRALLWSDQKGSGPGSRPVALHPSLADTSRMFTTGLKSKFSQ